MELFPAIFIVLLAALICAIMAAFQRRWRQAAGWFAVAIVIAVVVIALLRSWSDALAKAQELKPSASRPAR